MHARGYQQLIVRTKCLESIPQQERVDRHGKVGVVTPPGNPSLHIGHLHLCHWLALGPELFTLDLSGEGEVVAQIFHLDLQQKLWPFVVLVIFNLGVGFYFKSWKLVLSTSTLKGSGFIRTVGEEPVR